MRTRSQSGLGSRGFFAGRVDPSCTSESAMTAVRYAEGLTDGVDVGVGVGDGVRDGVGVAVGVSVAVAVGVGVDVDVDVGEGVAVEVGVSSLGPLGAPCKAG